MSKASTKRFWGKRAHHCSQITRWRRRRALERLYGKKCIKCGEVRGLRLDHVLPFSKGGDFSLGNLQLLCAACDQAKGAQHIDYRPFHPNSRPVPR